jgi:hypothetical protein
VIVDVFEFLGVHDVRIDEEHDRHVGGSPGLKRLLGEAETVDLVEIGAGACGVTLNVAVPVEVGAELLCAV